MRFITITSEGYAHLTENCVRSLRLAQPALRPDEFRVYMPSGQDGACFRGLAEVAFLKNDRVPKGCEGFHDPTYWHFIYLKAMALTDAVARGEPFIYTDGDVFFFRDPRPELEGRPEDVLFQDHAKDGAAEPMLCMGFLAALRPAKLGGLFASAMTTNDEPVVAQRLTERRDLSWGYLPRPGFPGGQAPFSREGCLYHFNWIIRPCEKVAAMRKAGCWLA